MTSKRLYLYMFFILCAGYLWLGWNLLHPLTNKSFTPCLIKNITGIACPSCGTTRSVIAMAHGHIQEAAYINPFGLLAGIILIALPLWLLYDLIFKKDTLYYCYSKAQTFTHNNNIVVIIIAAMLMLINWIWNIYKGL